MEALSGQGGAASIAPRADAPSWHVAPLSGWLNDPNGPLYYNGAYHMFFQHLPGSAAWGFNLVWGHAASKDLVHWELLPHAIEPTPGTVDGDGCFSGCAVIDTDGTPALLYTGVRLRGSACGGPLPPEECDLGLPFIESQCVVYAEEHKGDWRLPYWRKSAVPFLTLPPPSIKLAGWRDPYIVGPPEGHPEHGWTMLIGSGIKEQGGTVLQYRSRNLKGGWQLVGELCSGKEADGTGIVWECPLLVQLPVLDPAGSPCSSPSHHSLSSALASSVSGSSSSSDGEGAGNGSSERTPLPNGARPSNTPAGPRGSQQARGSPRYAPPSTMPTQPGGHGRQFFFCISPDACTNPTLYYLGDYVEADFPAKAGDARNMAAALEAASTTLEGGPALAGVPNTRQGKFLIQHAVGPFRLDLGDVLYAPNTLLDPAKGRVLLWAWMQEARKVAGNFMYAGCLSCARELWLQYDGPDPNSPRLVQRPVRELAGLRRTKGAWLWPTRHLQQQQQHTTTSFGPHTSGPHTSTTSHVRAASQPSPLRGLSSTQGSVESLGASGLSRGFAALEEESQGAGGAGGQQAHDVLLATFSGGMQGSAPLTQEPAGAAEAAQGSEQGSGSGPGDVKGEKGPLHRVKKMELGMRSKSITFVAQASPFASLGAQSSFEADEDGAPFWPPAVDVVVCDDVLQAPPLPSGPEVPPGAKPRASEDGSLVIGPGQSYRVPHVGGACLDMEFTFALVWPEAGTQLVSPTSPQSGQALGLSRVSSGSGSDHPHAAAAPAPQPLPPQQEGIPGRVGDQSLKAAAPIPEGACSGLVLRSWQAGVEGAAAILYCWATNYLEVVFEALDPETHEFSLAAPTCRRVGGQLQCPPAPGQPLQLRVLLDYSLVEVFTGGGEVLSTRVYRGVPPPEEGSGIDLVSLGCATHVVSAAAYEMNDCWVSSGPLPVQVRPQSELAAQLSGLHLFSPMASTPASRAISRAASLLLGRMSDTGSIPTLSRRTSRAGDLTPPPEPDTDSTHAGMPGALAVTMLGSSAPWQMSSLPPLMSPRASQFNSQFNSLAGTPPHPHMMTTTLPDPRAAPTRTVPTTLPHSPYGSMAFEVGSPTAFVLQSAITTLASARGPGQPKVTYLPPRHSSQACAMLGSARMSRTASIESRDLSIGGTQFDVEGLGRDGHDGPSPSGSISRGSAHEGMSFLERRPSQQPQVVVGM